jgi:hypothetical protein
MSGAWSTVHGPIAQSVELRTFNRGKDEATDAIQQDSAPSVSGSPRNVASPGEMPPRSAAAFDRTDEEILEAKMLDADIAGNVTLSAAYQRRLEQLRAGRPAGNVVALRSRR